jgi:hypothetical protein
MAWTSGTMKITARKKPIKIIRWLRFININRV